MILQKKFGLNCGRNKDRWDKIKNPCISSFKKRASENFLGKKSKIRASQVKFIKKRVSQKILDPIQKRALSRSVQLEAVYLEALLYTVTFPKSQKTA